MSLKEDDLILPNEEDGEFVEMGVKPDISYYDGRNIDSFSPDDITLLEFDPPELVTSATGNPPMHNHFYIHPDHLDKPNEDPLKTLMIGCVSEKDSKTSEDFGFRQLLSLIHEPEEWIDSNDRQHYVRHISTAPVDPSHPFLLEYRLYSLLHSRGAQSTGVCPIRRHLFEELFDEIIRQVSLEIPERGIMLLSCRDELRRTRAAVWSLFASSESFIASKSVRRYSDEVLAKNVQMLHEEASSVRKIIAHLNDELTRNSTRQTEEIEKMYKKHHDELEYLKHMNNALKKQMAIFTSKPIPKSYDTEKADALRKSIAPKIAETQLAVPRPSKTE